MRCPFYLEVVKKQFPFFLNFGSLLEEIVEYNPDRDRHGITAKLISDVIGDLLPQIENRRSAASQTRH